MKTQNQAAGDERAEILCTLKSGWAKYRRQLTRSQRRLSVDALHDLRVQTRRLLACLEVFSPVAGGLAKSATVRTALDKRLSALGPLRDAQVHLEEFDQARKAHPEIQPLHQGLRRRERRLLKAVMAKLKRTGTRKLGHRIGRFSRRLAAGLAEAHAPQKLRDAFARTVEAALGGLTAVCRADFQDHRAVHSTRILLKQLRYGADCLPPTMRSIPPAELKRVRAAISWMGRIHDLDVQLARFDKQVAKGHLALADARAYRGGLTRRRARLIRDCLVFLRRRRTRVKPSAPPSLLPE